MQYWDLEMSPESVWERRASPRRSSIREKSVKEVIFLLLEKPSALWPGETGGEFCGRFRGLWLFVHRCVQPQEEKRLQSAAQAKKMLLNIGKRRGRTRKNMAVVLGTAAVLLAGGMFFAVRERKPSFKEALTEVTTLYYDTLAEKKH